MHCFPKTLYKYRKFDEYTVDMLKTGYIYFSPANKLDDPSECSVEISENLKNENIEKEAEVILDFIQSLIKPYSNNYLDIDWLSFFKDGIWDKTPMFNTAKNYFSEIDQNVLEKVIEVIDIPNKLDETTISNFKDAMYKLINAPELTGICSLTELNNSNEMWNNYAANNTGYCIEYDVEEFLIKNPKYKKDLFKVVYNDYRDNNPIEIILKEFYFRLFILFGISKGTYDLEDAIGKIFYTKSVSWSYQREWRFIGEPNDNTLCLPIKAVYIGKNMTEEDKNVILDISKQCGFNVYT
ncbi:MAG: DUF2971 domain-containing protein [Acholeplasmataceae bacterium]|jgi:hypothetical protein